MGNIQDIHVALVLGGVALGIAIILILLKIIGSIFGAFVGGIRRDYPPYPDDRDPRGRGLGCFFLFLLLIGALVFGAKTLRDGKLFASNIVEGDQTEQLQPPTPALVQVKAPRELDYDEVPEYADTDQEPEPIAYDDQEEMEETPAVDDGPYNPHIIQPNFFFYLERAEKRMAELYEEFDGAVGMYHKQKDGRTGYAIYIGPFYNRSKAQDVRRAHGLRGDVLPCDQLKLLRYEGN
ncbi:MAG: SPOR domain-containing protein [Saprospiraceae bacterium]